MSEIEITQTADQYCNIGRMFVLKNGNELLRIHSGTDGIKLITFTIGDQSKTWFSLTKEDCERLSKELAYVFEFSQQAKKDSAAVWTARNNAYAYSREIEKAYGVTEPTPTPSELQFNSNKEQA